MSVVGAPGGFAPTTTAVLPTTDCNHKTKVPHGNPTLPHLQRISI